MVLRAKLGQQAADKFMREGIAVPKPTTSVLHYRVLLRDLGSGDEELLTVASHLPRQGEHIHLRGNSFEVVSLVWEPTGEVYPAHGEAVIRAVMYVRAEPASTASTWEKLEERGDTKYDENEAWLYDDWPLTLPEEWRPADMPPHKPRPLTFDERHPPGCRCGMKHREPELREEEKQRNKD